MTKHSSDPRDEELVLTKVPEIERSTMYVQSWKQGKPIQERFFLPKNKFLAAEAALVEDAPFRHEFAAAIREAIDRDFDELQFELSRSVLDGLLPEWPRYIVRSAVWNREVKWLRRYWLEGGPNYDPEGREEKEAAE